MSTKNLTNDLCGQSILFKKNGLVASSVIITGLISIKVEFFNFNGNNGLALGDIKNLPIY